ncbi:uncharacterized protein LOC107778967 [Nicotiana tabacum]|uniref:Uncharacterized protein LOC107778967 n=2 Tax=Nicotiana tabacum TaxID=4097 RepID=A0AC58UUM2_TOBAC|nr:PREDICTED: uncharacterized protein LOC107778967 isoform X2 [Nicotiana tabacum]
MRHSNVKMIFLVRIVRLCHVPDRDKPDNTVSLELIIQDEKGDRIHATVGRSLIRMFKQKIKELSLYFMKNFVVGPNYTKLKYMRHKLKLAFTHKMIVEEANDHLFGMSIFDLKPYEYLINKIDVEESELFDVIGEVVSYGEVESHNQGDKIITYMNVELEDHERNNISATFWGEFVDQILPHLEGLSHEPVIVVMQ